MILRFVLHRPRLKDMANEECRKLRASLRKFSRQDRRKRGILWKSPVTPARIVVETLVIRKVEGKQQNLLTSAGYVETCKV